MRRRKKAVFGMEKTLRAMGCKDFIFRHHKCTTLFRSYRCNHFGYFSKICTEIMRSAQLLLKCDRIMFRTYNTRKISRWNGSRTHCTHNRKSDRKKHRLSIGNAMHYCCPVEFHNSWLISIDTACGLPTKKEEKSVFRGIAFFVDDFLPKIFFLPFYYYRWICIAVAYFFSLSISLENATDLFFFLQHTLLHM